MYIWALFETVRYETDFVIVICGEYMVQRSCSGFENFICGYARVKLMDNIHWGVIDTLGKIAIYPNLDYILPLESFKIWGNNNAVKIAGRYKGTEVAYIIDPMSRINLPIDFEFMPNFDLEEYSFPQKATSTKRNNLFTNDNSNKFSSLDSREEWEDQTLDAFEGDESNYWNIE